jgi:hypothetical protein
MATPLRAAVAALALLVGPVACSSKGAGSQSVPDASTPDALAENEAGDDTGYDTGKDAGGDGDTQDTGASDVYPAPHHPLPSMISLSGGPVLASPTLVTITFAGDPNRDQYRAFDTFLPTSTWWADVTAGYGIDGGTVATPIELPDTVSGKTLDNTLDLKPMLANLVADGTLPFPDANTLYVMYFPQAATITDQGLTLCQGLYGYHDYFMLSDAGVAPYAVIPQCKVGGFSTDASHEVIEGITDPLFTSYYMFDDAWTAAGGGEIADVCNRTNAWVEMGYQLNRAWSNVAVARGSWPCQPGDPGAIFFGAIADTTVIVTQEGYSSDGYLLMTPGTSQTFDVTVFSEAALPNALSLYVGVQSTADPSSVAPITKGVSATLSPSAGTNGTHVALAITTDKTTVPGDYHFTIQAVLNSTTYTSMPAILRIQ